MQLIPTTYPFDDVKEFHKLVADIARGMRWLHQHGVYHRDLWSANILITFEQDSETKEIKFISAKIADFGISQMEGKVNIATVRGNMRVYPPECCTLDIDQYRHTFAADVFMFGMLVSEALERRAPYQSLSTSKAVNAKLAGQRPELKKHLKKLEFAPYAELIERCWSPDFNSRPSFGDILTFMEQQTRADKHE